MTTAPKEFSRQKLQTLLAKAKHNRPVQDSIDAPKYDWNQARHFNSKQMESLNLAAEKLAGRFSDSICKISQKPEMKFTSEPASQIFGRSLDISQSETNYSAIIQSANNPCGIVFMNSTSAQLLLAHILGDTDTQAEPSRTVSPLEISLLEEIVAAIGADLARMSKESGGPEFKVAVVKSGAIDCSQLQNDQCCKFTLKCKLGQNTAELSLVIKSPLLNPIAGAQGATASANKDEIPRAILQQISTVSVPMMTTLAMTEFNFDSIMSLQQGDILVFDNAVDDLVQVSLAEKPAFAGRLAQSDGHYAVTIEHLLVQSAS